MTARSSITITYDGNNITSDVMYQSANFEMNAGAVPGQFSFRVKDLNRTHNFIVGKEVTVTLDGQKIFGGIVLIVNRTFAFNVVDTSNLSEVEERIWEISGADYNIWLDKLVLHNPSNYLKAIEIPRQYDGSIIRNHLGNYMDVPAGMNLTDEVDNIRKLGGIKSGKFAFPTQGATIREVLEKMRTLTGATYFIDADKKLHWHAVGKTVHNWGLTDKPGNYDPSDMIGCREVNITQDGAGMVTDALVWSGNQIYADSDSYQADGGGLFFNRYPDPPANSYSVEGEVVWQKWEEQRDIDNQDKWGRWQYAEQIFGEGGSNEYGAVRAYTLVGGPGGTEPNSGVNGGLGQPLWDVNATWFGHDVPGQNHIRAGYFVNLIFWALGTNNKPLVQFLPMRHCTVTFPLIPEDPTGTQTYVQFRGRFGISYSDHRKLWRVLKQGRRKISTWAAANAVASRYSEVENAEQQTDSGSGGGAATTNPGPAAGAFGQLSAEEIGMTDTTYATGHAYIPGTLRVYLNGLYQRPGIEYAESDPATGEIEFYAPLYDTDEVFIEFRAAGDTT